MKENVIVKLSERDHVLYRPNQYIGSVDEITSEEFVLQEDGSLTKDNLTYVPGLIKIINEILDNSIDEAIRTGYQHANKIDIDITDASVTIKDNGRGIPIQKVEGTKKYAPDIAFTEARSGSNFNDDDRTTIGMNGVGSFATNCFSLKFTVDTADGNKKFSLKCLDNLQHAEHSITKSNQHYTKVYFEPDLERFHLDKINETHKNIIKQRIYFLSVSHPQIKFRFNKNTIKVKNGKELVKSFSDTFQIIEKDNYFFAVMPSPSDDFFYFTYVNGLYIKEGGNHIDYLTNEIVTRLRDRLSRNYKNIKPGDIKNKIQIISFFNNFPNPKFSSQTKEMLTNSYAEVRGYLNLDSDELDKFAYKIYRDKELIESITETYRVKEELKKQQELKSMNKARKKLSIEKYFPPTKNRKYFVLCEGDSATSSLMRVLGRENFGYFSLRGKPLNAHENSISKISSNKEWKNIVSILNMNLSHENPDIDFENVLIATDADLDGILIRGLVLTFFQRFAPTLIKKNKIKILSTPMITAEKSNKIEEYFMSFEKYLEFQSKNKNYDYNYYKGLGSWNGKDDLGQLIENYGLDTFIEPFEVDKELDQTISNWMSGKNSDVRKDYLRGKEFDIFKI